MAPVGVAAGTAALGTLDRRPLKVRSGLVMLKD
jgi:hypothetical protein